MAVLDFGAPHAPIVRFGRQRQRRLGREGRRVARVARAARRRHLLSFPAAPPSFPLPVLKQVLTRQLVTAPALRRRRARGHNGTESPMALRSQRPRVLLAGFRLLLLGLHLCAHYSSRDLCSAGGQGEQQASSTGDCNYTSARTTTAALLSQAHRHSTASHQCTAKSAAPLTKWPPRTSSPPPRPARP